MLNNVNFSGLIMTDDLSMGAIKQYTDNVSEAVLAVNAGNDILLTSDYYIHFDAVVSAFKSGVIAENIINKACRRILAWKLKYLLNHDPQPYDDNTPEEEGEEDKNYTVLIIISIFLALLIIGALVFFFIMWLRNNKKNEKKEYENIDAEAGLI